MKIPPKTTLTRGSPRRGLLRPSLGASLALLLLLAQSPAAGEGVDVGKTSAFTKFVSADQVERSAQQQYLQLRQQASSQHALAPDRNPASAH